ncbi:hypothetical protein EWT54_24265 [Escherichia coli O25b:H4]|nr:hypothetical protein EWT54_24265 [Escherichia coli O25b:H4]
MVVAVLTYPGILPYPTLPNNCSDYYVPSLRWLRVCVVYCFHQTTLTFPTLHLITMPAGYKFYPRFYVSTSKSIIKALINMHSFEIQLSPIG